MAERRRRVGDMTTAVELLSKYQKTFNKKYTQEEAGDLVLQQALMRDRAQAPQLFFEMLPEVAGWRHITTTTHRPPPAIRFLYG